MKVPTIPAVEIRKLRVALQRIAAYARNVPAGNLEQAKAMIAIIAMTAEGALEIEEWS